MKNKHLDFLCFLAKQASNDVREIVAQRAFQLLYPIEIKVKQIQEVAQAQAFQFLYPIEQKQKQICEQIAYRSFKVLYPIEQAYKAIKNSETWKEDHQEQSFLPLVKKEKIQAAYQRQKTLWIQKTRCQTQKIQARLTRRKKSVRFFTRKLPMQCSKMQMSIHEAHIWYLHSMRFKIKYHKLARIYEDVLIVIRRCYDVIENRIVAYFTMLFGIFLRWARGSSLVGI